jgi:glycosyltransferase involved in cell wall biosynthesis
MLGAKYKVNAVKPVFCSRNLIGICFIWISLFLKMSSKGIFLNKQFDLVISSTSNLSDLGPAWIISKIKKKPLLVIFQTMAYGKNLSSTYKIIKERIEQAGIANVFLIAFSARIAVRLAAKADLFFCLTKSVAGMLEGLGFQKKKMFIMGAGVNLEVIKSIEQGPKEYDAVFLGRIETSKGIGDLLEAWKGVVDLSKNRKLLLIGSGSFLEKAKQFVEENKLSLNVEFKGFTTGIDKYVCLIKSKIFVYPSVSEGLGHSVIEAMACGLPIVCYRIPVFEELFSGCESVIMGKGKSSLPMKREGVS